MSKLSVFGKRLWRSRAMLLVLADVLSVVGVYFFALLLRFDFHLSTVEDTYLLGYRSTILIMCAVTVAVFFLCRLYHSIWRLASLPEAETIIRAYLLLIPCYAVVDWLAEVHMPRSYYVMGFVLSFCATVGIRFSYRLARFMVQHASRSNAPREDRVMVIGAGTAGQVLIRELQNSDKIHTRVCCVIDDNPHKLGKFIEGVEVVGNRHDIVNMAARHRVGRIVFAIPSMPVRERTQVLNLCKLTNCRLQTVPGMYQFITDEVSVSRLRDVDLADLLGREQVQVNNDEIFADLAGKTVLVTGGGGTIGSELCRQIAQANPGHLIVFDIYENNAYAIQQELRRAYPELRLSVLIGSVRNTNRINWVIRTYRPDTVFHAAAHKHVPLMEDSPNEAIKNNAIGTWKTAQAAAKWGVKKFVLISTDKAVNPTNMMGASKRICEMVVQMMDRASPATRFVAVRFGNVLGSNGSVIPLFKEQIAAGGPVTVTDKRIIRYFMTIPEAVSLVLQASFYAQGGEIFVLDMGEPVKIDDMARNLIRLSGFTPDVDIKIEYTGLRPGEKLYEELLLSEEGLQDTPNALVHIGKPIEMDDALFLQRLQALDEASRREAGDIRALVSAIVPTYCYSDTPQPTPVSRR